MPYNKRYNLTVSEEMWEEIEKTAEREALPVAEVIRRFINLGLIATQPGTTLTLNSGDKSQHVRVFPERHKDDGTISLW